MILTAYTDMPLKVLLVPKGPPWPETPKPASMLASELFQRHISSPVKIIIRVNAILYCLLRRVMQTSDMAHYSSDVKRECRGTPFH